MKIYVTGSSGCLARTLLPALFELDFVESVTGIDIVDAPIIDKKYRHYTRDMRDPDLMSLVAGHDAVIHLGFAVSRGKLSLENMYDINVKGSRNVIRAAQQNGIKKFVNMSSVSVYGSGEGLTELADRNPAPWFPYAHHKADVERYIESELPQAVQFRSHLIVGANAQRFLREIFLLPMWLDFGAAPPKQQVVNEKDVVEAILIALQRDVSGIYNLAASDVIALGGDYIRKGEEEGRKIRRMPFGIVRAIALTGKLFMKKDLLTLISMLGTTATVNCDKAHHDLGWRAQRSAWDARTDALGSLQTLSYNSQLT